MKLKTAVKGFYETFKNPADRIDLVSFLRRYSNGTRLGTHYACRGNTTKNVVSFIESLGFEKDTDYSVLSSTFDPLSNSIRWTSNGKKFKELTTTLSDINWTVFDMLGANLKMTPEEASNLFTDTDTDDTSTPEIEQINSPEVWDSHFLPKMLHMSDRILDQIIEYTEDGSKLGPNGKQALALAKTWASSVKGKPERPFILPLPVLEVYYHMHEYDKPMLFRQDDRSIQACRLCIRTERNVPYGALTQAPISEVLEGGDNPLKDYLCDSAETLKTTNLERKEMAVLMCDAPMFFHEGEDLLTPVTMACEKLNLWKYVQEIYVACYTIVTKINVGLINNVRIAVSDRSETWEPSLGMPMSGSAGFNENRPSRYGEHMTAKYAVVISDKDVSGAYTYIENFIGRGDCVRVTESTENDYSDFGLTVEELPWEWFSMIHGSIYTKNRDTSSKYNPLSGRRNKHLDEFRKWKSAVTGTVLANMSSPIRNPLMRIDDIYDRDYNAMSAFFNGALPMSFRLELEDPYAALPMVSWGGDDKSLHPENVVISNVFSGMYTDLSPVLTNGVTKDVFPIICGHELCNVMETTTGEEKHAITSFLDEMAKDGLRQVKMAKRSKNVSRVASVVVETNIDAKKFLTRPGFNVDRFRKRIGTAFLQNILLNRNDVYVATDESLSSLREDSGKYARNDFERNIVEELGRDTFLKLFDGPDYISTRVPDSIYTPEKFGSQLTVKALTDIYGRLVLVFSVYGNILQYARLSHRHYYGMPKLTEYMLRKINSEMCISGTFTVNRGDESKFETVVKYLRMQHKTFMSDNYSGSRAQGFCGDLSPDHLESFGAVEPEIGPNRSWFLKRSMLSTGGILV